MVGWKSAGHRATAATTATTATTVMTKMTKMPKKMMMKKTTTKMSKRVKKKKTMIVHAVFLLAERRPSAQPERTRQGAAQWADWAFYIYISRLAEPLLEYGFVAHT